MYLLILKLFDCSETVRGMMYYRKALILEAFLDMAKREGNIPYQPATHPNLVIIMLKC
jgi:hypothetical protein